MYPFELSHAKPYRYGAPFFLGSSGKAGGPLDIFLNILLFMPFGFGIGTKLLRCGTSRRATLIYTGLAGALFSYAIELTQLYIPFRDSGWQDVLTNATGAFLGCAVAFLLGNWIFRHLSRLQWNAQMWITPGRLTSVLVVYFGIWFIASAFLTRKISLQDWRSDCFLFFGNDSAGRRPWKGKVLQLQIWNRALPTRVAEQLTSSPSTHAIDDPLVNLDFGDQPPNGTDTIPPPASRPVPIVAAPTWSKYVVTEVKQTNQFSIRVVLMPRVGAETNGPILSLSRQSGFANFYIGERGDDIVFWFRSPVTIRGANLDWKIPDALGEGAVRTVVFSYDGSAVGSYMDGQRIETRRLGVQAALASYVRRPNANELNGYRYIYYALLFCPAGVLLGIVVMTPLWRRADRVAAVVLGTVVPAIVLEWILMRATRAPFSIENVALAMAYLIVGLLWMNADGPLQSAPGPSSTAV